VYENIALGLSGTDKEKLPESEKRVLVEKACRDAYADEFVQQLPEVCSKSMNHKMQIITYCRKSTDYFRDMKLSCVNGL
jgi:ABC-type multidrug transport system fused ATPase/permease subunit